MMGEERTRIILCGVLFLLLGISIAHAEKPTCIYFFYGNGCPHCAKVEPVISKLEMQYPYPVEVHRFEVYDNRSNLLLLIQLFDSYNISEEYRGVPAVFIGNTYLIGDKPILENLEPTIRKNLGADCPELKKENITGTVEQTTTSPLERLSSLSLFVIIGAALVDSINPCAIAVLLILLGALVVSGERRRALRAGSTFTLAIYISYFLFGLGIFSALQISGLSFWFYKIVGILAILIGAFNIKDFFWYGGGGFVMEIPRSWRPTLKRMLTSVTSPLGAFLMGFGVCLFELPCTGGPYFVILGLLAERMTMFASIPLLLLYNVFFVLPLVIITLAVYFGFSTVERTTEWKDRNIRRLHLIAGIIMLALGVIIVLGLV